VIAVRGQILLPRQHRSGYLHVTFNRSGYRTSHQVHVLVLTAFAGPRPDGMVVRHLNGDRADNRLANLAWGTASENVHDTVRHGTHAFARRTHCPQGHVLAEPNLVACLAKRGYRDCLACNRGRTTARNARVRRGAHLDWRAIADAKYFQLTGLRPEWPAA